MPQVSQFAAGSVRIVLRGNIWYWLWVSALLVLIGIGGAFYVRQLQQGLITTNMRDQVSWAFYIGNFTFLVGVAAAAVLLVIPAYVYNWKPIKEVVILGELLAIDPKAWRTEMLEVAEYLDSYGERTPHDLKAELADVVRRLDAIDPARSV